MSIESVQLWSAVLAGGAARRLGILDALLETDATAEELASRCGLDLRGCQTLLDTLASFELLDRRGENYHAPEHLPMLEHSLASIAARVKGSPPQMRHDQVEHAGRDYPSLVTALAPSYGTLPAEAAPLLRARHVLDVGAGSAVWSLAIAELDPHCLVTALDLEPVMAVARARVAEAGLSDQFSFSSGDFFEVPLPEDAFDLVLLGQVCHLFGERRLRTLFDRLRPTLNPGGRIAIIDGLRRPGLQSRAGAVHDLTLFARTDEGTTHAFSSYAGWLQECGFADIRRHTLSPEMSIVFATRHR